MSEVAELRLRLARVALVVRRLSGASESYRRALEFEHYFDRGRGSGIPCDNRSHREGECLLSAIQDVMVALRPMRNMEVPDMVTASIENGRLREYVRLAEVIYPCIPAEIRTQLDALAHPPGCERSDPPGAPK